MIAHPVQSSADWGRVLVGGSVFPGILTSMTVPPRVWEWAVQQGYGQTKVTIYRSTGILEKISFTHFLQLETTGADDWRTLTQQFLPVLIPGWPNQYAGKPKSLPLTHPAVQFLGAQRTHLVELHAPVPPQGEMIPEYYTIIVGEDVPQTRLTTGPPEPAKINGPPTPKNQIEATLLGLSTAFKNAPPLFGP